MRHHRRRCDVKPKTPGSSSEFRHNLFLVPVGSRRFGGRIVRVHWTRDYPLFILGTLSFAAALAGRIARRKRWPGWVRLHIIAMGVSYILLLTAFYVDNGKSLPLWKELPSIAYWILPGAIGGPIIGRALLRPRPF